MTGNETTGTTTRSGQKVTRPLSGKVAVVAGATRGAGRGIATELGAAGATVYCTGRSTRDGRSDYDRAETIEETAELVTEAGGEGRWLQVDHTEPDQVRALARRIDQETGGLDILINDIGGEHLHHSQWGKPIWEHDLDLGRRILGVLEAHMLTAHCLLPLLVRRPGGLHVELTDGHDDYNRSRYRVTAYFDIAKTSLNRLGFVLGHELDEHDCTAMSVTPGWLRSEMMLDIFGVTEDNWRRAWKDTPTGEKAPADFAVSESPRLVGRCLAAVAADADRHRWNQRSTTSERLARHYGVTDVDGSQPRAWSFIVAKEADPDGEINVADYR